LITLRAVSNLNAILDALSSDVRDALLARLERVSLRIGDVLEQPDERFAYAYLPIDCVLSATVVMGDGDEVEIATIGYEGFHPMSVLLGATHSLVRTVCQVPGESYRMPIDDFLRALESYPTFRSQAQRFGQGAIVFMSQSIACNRRHPLIERCARWLLMTHDRVRGNDFRLTQEYLAVMLGVRRPAVSLAAQTLQNAGLIAYRRGSIKVLDREGLEAVSCECYRVVADAFQKLVGAPQ
jgi:hypothetical protein